MPYIGRAPTASITKLEDADQDTKIQVEESSDEDIIRFDTGGAERMTVASGGDVTVSTGNLVIGTSGKGIDFSATADGTTMSSELLDDYEEGTFTATARLGGAAGTDNGTANMNYTKIGNQVHVEGSVTFDSSASGEGLISISGLPFTVAGSARAAFMIGDRINATLLSNNASATAVNFYLMTSSTSGSLANATDSLMGTGAGKSIWISLTYFV